MGKCRASVLQKATCLQFVSTLPPELFGGAFLLANRSLVASLYSVCSIGSRPGRLWGLVDGVGVAKVERFLCAL